MSNNNIIFVIVASVIIIKLYSTNCSVSEWGACDGTKKTRTVLEATFGGTKCTDEEKVTEQSCNNCSVSEWGACDGTKKQELY